MSDGPRFVQIKSVMSLPLMSPLEAKKPVLRAAKRFVGTLDTPASARTVFQYSWDWVFTATQQGTIDGLTSGMAIGELVHLEVCSESVK